MGFGVDLDTMPLFGALFDGGEEVLHAATLGGNGQRAAHLYEIFRSFGGYVIRVHDYVRTAGKADEVGNKRVARHERMIAVEERALFLACFERFFIDDTEVEFEFTIQESDRGHKYTVGKERGDIPKRIFMHVLELFADLAGLLFHARKIVVYFVFIINGPFLFLHVIHPIKNLSPFVYILPYRRYNLAHAPPWERSQA